MKLSQFSHFLEKLEKTSERIKMTEILAALFTKAKKKEIDKIVYLSLGRLMPSFAGIEFNIAEKMMIKIIASAFNKEVKEVQEEVKKSGDLGETVFEYKKQVKSQASTLSVSQAYDKLMQIANEGGAGSQERKIKLMAELIKESDASSSKYIVRIPIGRLRLGFSDMTVLDALSWMEKEDKSLRPKIEAAYSIAADTGLIAKTFKARGLSGLKKIRSQPGIPILPARAERLPDVQSIIDKLGKCALEPKIDGFRVQIHLDRQLPGKKLIKKQAHLWEDKENKFFLKIFSRNLEDTTNMFPDIALACQHLLSQKKNLRNCILDGEAVGMNFQTGKPFSFQKTAQRKRKYDIKKTSEDIPLVVFVFDLLFHNDKLLINKKFRQRRKQLASLLNFKGKDLRLTFQKIASKPEQITKEFNRAVKGGWEGLMAKRLYAPYRPGARNYNWVKFKKSTDSKLLDTLDCLVLGYYRGRGKRASFGIGAFLVGVRDPAKQEFPTIAKIGTGLSDKQWVSLRKKCDQVKVRDQPKQYIVDKNLFPDIWCEPQIVVEIAADEITKSPIHKAGIGLALRFPRLKRFRDKNPEDITTIKEVQKLYQKQK
ncbi:MAG: ATP-dependent DNA ligase [Candidatus Shapirobacteria bacterium]